MNNELRTRTTSVIGPSWWLQPVLDLLHPKHRHTFRCITCGDRFEVEYRVGCFGPIGGEVRRLPQHWLNIPRDEQILCAHCGHGPWLDPVQEPLRQAAALQARIGDKVEGDLRIQAIAEMERHQRVWAIQLSREDFRRLDPAWFAALWEGGPSPNPRATLPKTPKKKARFYLGITQENLDSLPPLPSPAPELAEARRAALRSESQEIDQLVPKLKAAGSARLLHFVRFPSGPDQGNCRPETPPERGATLGCYYLHERTGAEMAIDLQNSLAAGIALRADPAIHLEILEERLLVECAKLSR